MPLGERSVAPTFSVDQAVNGMLPEQAWMEGRAISPPAARVCLGYVRQRLEGRIGWLVQDASGVLEKLIEGRVIEDLLSSDEEAT